MYQTIISSVSGNMAADIKGRSFYIAGSSMVTPGQQVWTDGKIIYGNTYTGSQPYVPTPASGGILWLIPYQEIQVIDKSFKVKKLCDTASNYITYNKKNFNAYIGGHWQKLPAIQDYTMLDACYSKEGDLLEIGFVGKPNYLKGYAGKTEAIHIIEESSRMQSSGATVTRWKNTDHYKYQAFYDFTDKTSGTPNFIKLVKNGKIEKSIGFDGILKTAEGDLKSYAAEKMGMQNIYKMYESVSPGKSQMTRNKDGGFTCMLSISCNYIAYCVKLRTLKEYYNGEYPVSDSHHFGKITASWRILVTEKGTKIIEKSYNISGVGESRGYIYWKELGDSPEWPCYFTIQPQGYGGDIDTEEPPPQKGLKVYYSDKGHYYSEHWYSWENRWVIDNDMDTGIADPIPMTNNFKDINFFTPQNTYDTTYTYSWRLDNATMVFDEKNYTLAANGVPFDFWSNTVFEAYPYKKGFLFVVFYMRDSKIKLIYWDSSEQKEVASCPYVGDYCRAFRVCEIKNAAKIKKVAGVKDG